MKLLTQTQCTVVKLAGQLAQMVKASAKSTSCKPLSSQDQFVCLDKFVNGLAVTCQSEWFNSASCLSRGRIGVLAFLHLESLCHRCILGFGRTMQQWNYVKGRENLNDGITVNMLGLLSVVGIAAWRWWCPYPWVKRSAPQNKRRSSKKYIHTTAKWLS